MPGVVDTSLPSAQQRQQLQDQLVAQGFTDVEAQSLAEQWMTTGTVAGSSQPVIPIDSASAQPPADPFMAASPDSQGLTDTSTDSEVMAAYLQQQGYDGFNLINAGWAADLDLGRSYEFIKGFAQGTVFSGLATGEALLEIASNPKQFLDGVNALVNSPQARAQLGEAVLNQFKTDLRMFEDAYASGDWKTAGQAAGKITTDFAQIAGGVQAIASLGVTTARAGGRLLLGSVDDLAFTKSLTQIGGMFAADGKPLMNFSSLTSTQKGVIGEVMGADLIKAVAPDAQRIGRIPGIGEAGIDDVLKVSRADVDFVVVEYKFGTSKLGNTLDGLQMSDSWLQGGNTGKSRLIDSVGRTQADAISDALRAGRVEKWLVHTDPFGNVTVGILDSSGKFIPKPVSGVIGAKP